jgi:glycosyltransferase involved in cell wall biosynthesis
MGSSHGLQRKKVLIVIDAMSIGGSQEWVVNFCRELTEVDITVLSVFGDNAYKHLLDQLPHVRVKHASRAKGTDRSKLVFFLPYVMLRFLFMRRWLADSFDWVNVRLPLSMTLWWMFGLCRRTKCHFNVDCDARQLYVYERLVFKLCLPAFQSISIVESVRSGYSFIGISAYRLLSDPVFVTSRASDSPIVYNSQYNLLFIARLVPQKGLTDALAIMRSLENTSSKTYHLHVLGDGPDRRHAEAYCATNSITNVTFYGYVSSIADYVTNASGLLKTAIGEPVNSVAREFMLLGKPVFSTIEADDDHRYQRSGTLIALDRDNPNQSAKVISKSLEEANNYPDIVGRSLKIAESYFSSAPTKKYFLDMIFSET